MDKSGDNFEALHESTQLLGGFSHASAIGLAMVDTHLRFQAVNNALAAINGVPAAAHLGNTLRDVLGDVAAKVEPIFQRVFVTVKLCCTVSLERRCRHEVKLATGLRTTSQSGTTLAECSKSAHSLWKSRSRGSWMSVFTSWLESYCKPSTLCG